MKSEKVTIIARHLGRKIRIADLMSECKHTIYSHTDHEALIILGKHAYIYIQDTGGISFLGCDENSQRKFLGFAGGFVDFPVPFDESYHEDFLIEIIPDQALLFTYNSIKLSEINPDILKIILLNVSRSVALDYFITLSGKLLHETGIFTRELESKGKLNISKTRLLKFTGHILNTHNQIVDNLHFLDDPEAVWEVEYLAKINTGLSELFKLKTRFRKLEYTLSVIDKSLNTFAQLTQHQESKKLDLIIIMLIAFEILNALIRQHF
jgi:uncharacterized Rmd1/YagE family protein